MHGLKIRTYLEEESAHESRLLARAYHGLQARLGVNVTGG